jgi:hypothetical protein
MEIFIELMETNQSNLHTDEMNQIAEWQSINVEHRSNNVCIVQKCYKMF